MKEISFLFSIKREKLLLQQPRVLGKEINVKISTVENNMEVCWGEVLQSDPHSCNQTVCTWMRKQRREGVLSQKTVGFKNTAWTLCKLLKQLCKTHCHKVLFSARSTHRWTEMLSARTRGFYNAQHRSINQVTLIELWQRLDAFTLHAFSFVYFSLLSNRISAQSNFLQKTTANGCWKYRWQRSNVNNRPVLYSE